MHSTSLLLFLVSSSLSVTSAQLTMTSEGCADPTGFDTCWAAATSEATSLFAKYCTTGECTDPDNCYTPDANCAETTTCLAYTSWINCALSTCWNRVYGCEYQNLAIKAVQACPIANNLAPYVPAPHAAPGYCSCNMGFVYLAYLEEDRDGAGELYRCKNNNPASGATTCTCCAESSGVSTFFNSCPSTDPSQVPIFPILGYSSLLSSTCSSALSNVDCSTLPYNYTIPPGPTYDTTVTNQFFNAANIPANGTDPLSNNAGGPSTPVSGAVLTWSLYKGGETVASASVTTWNGTGAAASSGSGSGGTAGTTGTAKTTGSGATQSTGSSIGTAAATTTSSKSSGLSLFGGSAAAVSRAYEGVVLAFLLLVLA